MVEHFDEIKGAIMGIGVVLAGGIFAALVAALLALLSPINLIIAAAALLGAAWAGNWGGIREITASVIDFIMGIITVLAETFNSVILPQIQEAFNNLTEALNSMGLNWGDVWNAIVEAIKIVGIAIGVVIGAIITTIVGLVAGFASAFATATSLFDEFGRAFTSTIEGIATLFAGFATLIEGIMIGDWAVIWEGAILIFEGFAQTFLGVMDLLVVTVQSSIATILSFFSGFADAVVSIFTGLSSTLVGNSIIPDMVQAIIDTFVGMVEGIANAIGGVTEIISGIFSGIFGGEGGLDISAFTEAIPEALASLTSLFGQVTTAITGIATQISGVLTETFIVFTELAITLITQIHTAIMQVDLLIVKIYTITLPTLQAVTTTVMQAMVTAILQVNAVLAEMLSLIVQITAALLEMAEAAKTMIEELDELDSVFSDFEELIDLVLQAAEAFDQLSTMAQKAHSAIQNASEVSGNKVGIGWESGVGFQRGTRSNTNGALGLGYRIPPGFPNDTFGPMFAQSGEEMLITPRGMTIEGLIFDRLAALLSGSIRGGSVQNGKTVQVNFNAPIAINNGMDWDDFQMGVERTVAGAF
jgi:phage-related protein